MARKKKSGSAEASPQNTPPEATENEPAAEAGEIAADAQASKAALPIVGIGASAGGIEAMIELLEALPDETGMGFVFIQHLARNKDSMLASILHGKTKFPVVQAEDGATLTPNQVYVIPPDFWLEIAEGKLRLSPRPADHEPFLPIDFFFRSLAHYAAGKAVGVVLSGNGADGSLGLREIKAAGGITIAQQPETARYDSMPRAAIATGLVDLVLPPAEIAQELVRLARHPFVAEVKLRKDDEALEVPDDHLKEIFTLLRQSCGVDFSQYKQPTIRRRLQRRMALQKVSDTGQYVAFMRQNPAEAHALYQDILIHVTRFFRDPETFEALTKTVLPKILQKRTADVPIRVWVPGCSTGEEAYSVAMVLLEYLDGCPGAAPVQIFATDVSEKSVQTARAGAYSESIAEDVPAERLRRFFVKIDHSYQVAKSVRDLCVFARQDITRDPPFSKLDLIVCHNVLIYLSQAMQTRLMSVFFYGLKPGGFLMLAGVETVGMQNDMFSVVDKKHKIYVRRETAAPTPLLNFSHFSQAVGPSPPRTVVGRPATTVLGEADQVLLNRFSPPGVIVDHQFQIIQFRGQTGPYLEPAPGDPSLNLLKMARRGLAHALQTALQDARTATGPVRREGIRVASNGHERQVNVEVLPLAGRDQRHFLVLFEEAPATGSPRPSKPKKLPRPKSRAREDRLLELEQELDANRQYMQSMIQDLEAANEELQSANEEILSSNEELQSTNEELDTAKEELQATNEELNTLNEELYSRNEELSRVNSDLVNLLGSVQIAIVIVASDLRIRRFTPLAEKVLNLIPGDVGRPIGHIKPNIACPDLERLITESIDSVAACEREVQDSHGNWYSLRIRPYKNVDNRIDGAVLTLFEVEYTKGGEDRLRAARDYADAIIDALTEPLAVLDGELRVQRVNPAFCAVFGMSHGDLHGRDISKLVAANSGDGSLDQLLQGVLQTGEAVNGVPLRTDGRASDAGSLVARAQRLAHTQDHEPLILMIIEETSGKQSKT